MIETQIDLSSFSKDSGFYGEINLILTVKSFDLQAIRKRYISSRNNKSGKTGSVERRAPSKGGVISLSLKNGATNNEHKLCEVFEPRGIDFHEKRFAFAAENIIYILSEFGEQEKLSNPWFSYIHTVQFHPIDLNRIIISSSGFDLIQEYDYSTKKVMFEWLAWENGFNKALDPDTNQDIILTRDTSTAAELRARKIPYYLVTNPESDHLPTAKRAAFINSVTYNPDNPEFILATFFHEGKVYQINTSDNSSEVLLNNLKNPHGGHILNDNVIATSTASGEIFVSDRNELKKISFKNLPGKPEGLEDLEWIQNTLSIHNYLIAIDSNRTSFIIIDLINKKYDQIPYDNNWAVQDMVSGTLSNKQKLALSSIK